MNERIKVYVTRHISIWEDENKVELNNEKYAANTIWTLSEEPDKEGWETDSACVGYGLTKEKADYYAKCINEYERLKAERDRYRDGLDKILAEPRIPKTPDSELVAIYREIAITALREETE